MNRFVFHSLVILSLISFPSAIAAQTCSATTDMTVVVCSPANGATVNTTFTVQAYANVSGGVYRFELWANGTKLATVRDSGSH
jgi:hypothetical protein